MSYSKIVSFIKLPLWGFLAMTCISCAHQSKESALMIDSEAPADMHVWSESKQVDEVVTAENNTEEAQLNSIEEEASLEVAVNLNNGENNVDSTEQETTEIPVAETSPNKESLALDENKNNLDITIEVQQPLKSGDPDLKAALPVIVATQTAKWEESATKTADSEEEVKSEGTIIREVSSEVPADEITPPSIVAPIIGAPSKLKTQESAPIRKPNGKKGSNLKDTKQSDEKVSINAEAFKVSPTAPSVEIVDSAKLVVIEPKANALGEEEETSPELASVEIATFIQHHWLAVLITALCGTLGIYLLVNRNKEDESQTI